jgi:hypothetical protein
MLRAGLDLSRRKVDVCLVSSAGEIVDERASPPDADGLPGLAARASMWGPPVRGVIESMHGARFSTTDRKRKTLPGHTEKGHPQAGLCGPISYANRSGVLRRGRGDHSWQRLRLTRRATGWRLPVCRR